MRKRIVIPLYDHASADEVRELLDRLDELALALEPVYETRPDIGDVWTESDGARLDRYRRRAAELDPELDEAGLLELDVAARERGES